MKLSISGIGETFNFEEHPIYTVCVENKMLYKDIVTRLYSAWRGENDDIFLYDGNKKLDFTKSSEIVNNIFNLDFGGTKLTNALYNNLKTIIQSSSLNEDYQQMVSNLTNFFDKVKNSSDYNIEWEDIDIISLLKVASFKFNNAENDNLLKRLLDYIHLYSDALGVKLFIFMNTKCIFNENEIGQLYHQCALEGCNILNIDCISSNRVTKEEELIIIDSDLCEIK